MFFIGDLRQESFRMRLVTKRREGIEGFGKTASQARLWVLLHWLGDSGQAGRRAGRQKFHSIREEAWRSLSRVPKVQTHVVGMPETCLVERIKLTCFTLAQCYLESLTHLQLENCLFSVSCLFLWSFIFSCYLWF